MKKKWDGIFREDSRFMLKASRVGCLMLLNVLWLACCVPVVTIGPATTAMYYVIFQYHTGRSDSVVRPFFRSFRRDFFQSLLLGLPLTLLWGILVFNALYLSGMGMTPLWIPYFVMVILALAVTAYGFPMLARYCCSLMTVWHNTLGFLRHHPLLSLRVMGLVLLPVLLAVFVPEFFGRTSFFWAIIGFSLTAYINGYWLLDAFEEEET